MNYRKSFRETEAHAIDHYKRTVAYFNNHPTTECSAYLSSLADRLHNLFGFSFEEIEALEISVL